jgi:probable rRNA maturation factor
VSTGPAALAVAVQFASRRPWVPSGAALSRWASAAHARSARRRRVDASGTPSVQLCIRVVGSAESRRLNRDYRGRDYPTNVLSFPADPRLRRSAGLLGDLVVCAPVVAREAREQRKARAAHWAHMIVHGVLHLHGLDHEEPRAARRMERREVEILAGFGYQDPYR